jgi:exopolysaccharide biosynthesis polyprenyl glycosylphosphotransferase
MSWQLVAKRLLDIAVSGVLLALHAPLLALVAAAVKLDSKGPVFFRQVRVGYNGRPFNCLKFRTMVQDAEQRKASLAGQNEMDGPVFKIRNDPRITRLGKILRKTSFDELPQLTSVLKGDMSLVGPRPPVPREVAQYQLGDLRRLSMKPGITCLWQVNGRSNLSFKKWMELDRQYIDEWSLWLDMKILARTVLAVAKGTGAA